MMNEWLTDPLSDLRNRPKGNYIFEADWESLYVLTEHWKTDIEFYWDDIRFMQNLIDKYFLWMVERDNIDAVRDADATLVETSRQCAAILNKVNVHLLHLAELIEDPFKYDSHQFRSEHEQLENDISSFVKAFRESKKEVFAVTEKSMISEVRVEQKIGPMKP